ncbi:polysaccharide deacetylase family protein [Pseudoalteromonas haloplanktis]|uniref:Polysaccharide deacetylase family protein n=1 Tax=Pseudoalteromonas haloplanktis TaxID=228 RepID=A0ABU1BHT5_PSEHA|nr:polysaccharide deacetylase family protein [Pseudoalteromonas haloplanktis]MDQ9094041.1 polysaccharide deacetylase family protein [Pseudoalteromonas haloplanktis]
MNGHFLSREINNEPAKFRRLLNKLNKEVDFINIEKAVELISSGKATEVKKTLLAFTFDDGFDDCYYSLAPVLEEYGINACFFINPNFVAGSKEYIKNFVINTVSTPNKRPMDWEQITNLKDRGFVIGSHTKDHVRLSELDDHDIKCQVEDSKYIIEKKLGIKCEYFAWPYGQFKDITEKALIIVEEHHKYVFSGCDYKNYFSYEGKVFNRRHFEACWSFNELKYFLSFTRKY